MAPSQPKKHDRAHPINLWESSWQHSRHKVECGHGKHITNQFDSYLYINPRIGICDRPSLHSESMDRRVLYSGIWWASYLRIHMYVRSTTGSAWFLYKVTHEVYNTSVTKRRLNSSSSLYHSSIWKSHKCNIYFVQTVLRWRCECQEVPLRKNRGSSCVDVC